MTLPCAGEVATTRPSLDAIVVVGRSATGVTVAALELLACSCDAPADPELRPVGASIARCCRVTALWAEGSAFGLLAADRLPASSDSLATPASPRRSEPDIDPTPI